MNKIQHIYNLLYHNFGTQGWWPVTEKGEGKPKYHVKYHNNKQRFEIIVGAILTQNTSWKNVERALENLNKKNLLDIKKLKKIDEKLLATLIKPAGYFNQKAAYIKGVADYIMKTYKSDLQVMFDKKLEDLRHELLALKGIGKETADS